MRRRPLILILAASALALALVAAGATLPRILDPPCAREYDALTGEHSICP